MTNLSDIVEGWLAGRHNFAPVATRLQVWPAALASLYAMRQERA